MRAGSQQWPRCTPAYAPPDVVTALHAGCKLEVTAAHDVWALGVVAFEAIAGQQAMRSVNDIRRSAAGQQAYPWEGPLGAQPPAWRHSRLRGLLLPCLARNAAARPSAAAVAELVSQVGQSTALREGASAEI